MIVTRTPLRVSFFGGGSDVEAFYSKQPGAVLSTTIDKYIRLAIQRVARPHVKVMYSEVEQVKEVDHIKHDRVRELLKFYDVKSNIEIASFADIPTKGTGLGSSSAFTVGLINGLGAYTGMNATRYMVAERACEIEIKKCGQKIGKQDQYAAAFGGFNRIRFYHDGVEVAPLNINSTIVEGFANQLLCFYTGQTRSASTILSDQVNKLETHDRDTFFRTTELADIALHAERLLHDGKLNDVGSLLHDGWQLKRKLSDGITNPVIDEMYETARNAGALGGKLLGAGGGGYLLVYVPYNKQTSVLEALKDFEPFVFNFTDEGSKVVYNDEPVTY